MSHKKPICSPSINKRALIAQNAKPKFYIPEKLRNSDKACRRMLSESQLTQQLCKNLVTYFMVHLKLSNAVRCVLFEWDEKTQRMVLLKSKMDNFLYHLQWFIQTIYVVTMIAYLA